MIRLSALGRARVVSESGASLGYLIDLRAGERCTADGPDGDARVSGLLCGRFGLLERFGLRVPGATFIAWGRVVRIEDDRIVVRDVRRPKE